MESTANENKPKVQKDHKVMLENRKKITLTGVTKALSANESSVVLQLNNFRANISGTQLHLNKLDMEQGIAEVVGEINLLKYSGGVEQKNFFKRLFQ